MQLAAIGSHTSSISISSLLQPASYSPSPLRQASVDSLFHGSMASSRQHNPSQQISHNSSSLPWQQRRASSRRPIAAPTMGSPASPWRRRSREKKTWDLKKRMKLILCLFVLCLCCFVCVCRSQWTPPPVREGREKADPHPLSCTFTGGGSWFHAPLVTEARELTCHQYPCVVATAPELFLRSFVIFLCLCVYLNLNF